jgi:hypothetical protein
VRGEIDGGRTFVMFQDLARGVGGHARRGQVDQVPGFVVRWPAPTPTPRVHGCSLRPGAPPCSKR